MADPEYQAAWRSHILDRGMRHAAAYVDRDLDRNLNREAKRYGSRAEVIRVALRAYFYGEPPSRPVQSENTASSACAPARVSVSAPTPTQTSFRPTTPRA